MEDTWIEIVKLANSKFLLAKNIDSDFYAVINNNEEVVSQLKIVRWFNNGFFLSEEKYSTESESRDGVTLYQHTHDFNVINQSLKIIRRFDYSRYYDHPFLFKDFKSGFLIYSINNLWGAINEEGEAFLPCSFPFKEVHHRIELLFPLKETNNENRIENSRNKFIYEMRLKSISSISYLQDIINNLKKNKSKEEIIYFLLLKRYVTCKKHKRSKENTGGYQKIDDEMFLDYFDTEIIVSYIKSKNKNAPLSVNGWDSDNMNYSLHELNNNLTQYFSNENENLCEFRSNKIRKFIEDINLLSFDYDKFKQVVKTFKSKIRQKNLRLHDKIYINNYRTTETLFKDKKVKPSLSSNGGLWIKCLYVKKILNFEDSLNLHLVKSINDNDIFYVVDTEDINNDLESYDYNDYIDKIEI